MAASADKAEVKRDLSDMSTRISGIVRTTAIGVIAVGWGLLITPSDRIAVAPTAVLIAIVMAFLALVLDWAQYLVGYLSSSRTFEDMEKDEALRGWTPNRLHAARAYLFGAKQVAAFVGVSVLVGAMLPEIIRLASHQ